MKLKETLHKHYCTCILVHARGNLPMFGDVTRPFPIWTQPQLQLLCHLIISETPSGPSYKVILFVMSLSFPSTTRLHMEGI